MLIKISELDVFFMSYNEPNAELNWIDLVSKVPWAKRVSGIKGFDSVHRYCGAASETEWLVTVDADTQIDPSFIGIEVPIHENGPRNFCWSSFNVVNGLTYGNGGIKVWHKPFAENMAFHEYGDNVDFCWDDDYLSINQVYSTVHINGSPLQAFRAGYREGVKLTLENGNWIKPDYWLDAISEFTLRNLNIWCTVGMDVDNGQWAIAGARTGVLDSALNRVSNEEVSDFDFIEEKFKAIKDPITHIKKMGREISKHTPLELPYFDENQSAFIKSYYE